MLRVIVIVTVVKVEEESSLLEFVGYFVHNEKGRFGEK